MKAIGITGGIGSGKSTVSRVFHALGVPVYDTDARAKMLMDTSKELGMAIFRIFGEWAFRTGTLDREYVAKVAFSNPHTLQRLNEAVHPAVAEDFKLWRRELEVAGHGYVVLESAILFESGFNELVDAVVTVNAPEDLRIERVKARDGVTTGAVWKRMMNQMEDDQRTGLADFCIVNDDLSPLLPQILELDEQFRN